MAISSKTIICITLCLAILHNCTAGEEHVTSAQVDAALKKGVEAVRRDLQGFGGGGMLGFNVICVMALLNAGVPRSDLDVSRAIERIFKEAEFLRDDYQAPYQYGLVNALLAMLKDNSPAVRRLAERMVSHLRSCQKTDGGWGDNSRTQFALLGLKAARDMNVEVPAEVFKRAKRYLEAGQQKDGSWGYVPGARGGYGSMTAAGISSSFIVNEENYKDNAVCGALVTDDAVQNGLKWLGGNFNIRENPQLAGRHFYFMYAIERIGVLTGQKYIGTHDWYREGADYLVPRQNLDGTWNTGEPLATEFAMLFLGKGREPIVMQKLVHAGEWNTDPYDAKNLAEQASHDLKMPMAVQVVDARSGASALADAPILYMQGRRAFVFNDAQRVAIKAFVESGGFFVVSNCCGSEAFDKSFRSELSAMFQDSAFDVLPISHEIYNLQHRITNPNAFMIEGLNTGCRTAVFYAPHDICCAWGGCKGCKDKACLAGLEAKNLGVNLIAYALDFKKMRDKLDEEMVIGGKGEVIAKRNALIIGQLHHNGDWNPDPNSMTNLAQTLKKDIGMKGDISKRCVMLGTDDPGDFPLLYLTGHRGFEYSASQVDALRTYLDRGGFLLADPCCGKLEFDTAFRKLCAQLYPGRNLEDIPLTHSVMKQPYVIDKMQYKPAVARLFPALANATKIEGISAPDGRLQILYSRFNFGCELQGHKCPGCLGMSKEDAYHIAVNALYYALSH